MIFKTPFHINNGILFDCDYKPFSFHIKRFRLTDDQTAAEKFLADCIKEGINFVHAEFTEALLTESDGALKTSPALDLLDDFMERCFQCGIYLAFTPVTEKIKHPDGWSEHAIRQDEPIFAERYFDALFRHVNKNSGKMFFEYENLAAIETILELNTFTPQRLRGYLHHMGCFVQHFFMNRLLDVYFLDRGLIPAELDEILNTYTWEQPVDWFPSEEKIRIVSKMDGIPSSAVKAYARAAGSPSWLPCAVFDCGLKALYSNNPQANGGGQGVITLEAVNAEFILEFPCKIASAKFRPSMREKLPMKIEENRIRFSLDHPRYGAFEINYNHETLPHFTVFFLMDPIIEKPQDALWLEPGSHETIDYSAAKTLAFKQGVHYLPEDRLRPISNHDVYLAPGAVLKCGLTCEKGENVKIYGSGIFDGTLTRRNPGENWKGRADDSFIHFFEGENIVWDGPMVFNSPFWNVVPEGTHNMTIRHHKAITWAVNSDGIQARSNVNLLIEDCFFKCADDSIAIKTRRVSGMHSHHITVRNIVTWNDAGSALEIGHTSQADILEDIVFENVEIIYTCSGLCHMYLIDHSTVQNVSYKNIYMENHMMRHVPEIYFAISQNFYSTDQTRGRIRNVTLENLHVEDYITGAYLKGFDEEHRVENVTVKDIFIHSGDTVKKYVHGEIPMKSCEFADKIKFVR